MTSKYTVEQVRNARTHFYAVSGDMFSLPEWEQDILNWHRERENDLEDEHEKAMYESFDRMGVRS